MPNRGEKDVKVTTEEGHRCVLKMQVTDVQKPLMSVARICGAGHKVTFTEAGGSSSTRRPARERNSRGWTTFTA